MPKITFIGAGSTVFAKNIIGDAMLFPALKDSHIALYDIDKDRLNESWMMLENLNSNINNAKATITTHLGVKNRQKALGDADYIINACQIGGYDSTLIDFDIPNKYGLRQTIGDTLGIGGIFRALRTVPVMMDFAKEIDKVCPDAWFLNFVNPMAILTGLMLEETKIKTVGLCHSVQVCIKELFGFLDIDKDPENIKTIIAGINHMAWLLEITENGKNIYPLIKEKAGMLNQKARQKNAKKHKDMVRLEMMRHFGYYTTESSEHAAEYTPYWIKSNYPELIEDFNIPLDAYPQRMLEQFKDWDNQRDGLINNKQLEYEKSREYAANIINAIETDIPFWFHGNVANTGFISNLPTETIVEIPCLADSKGIEGCHIGKLPTQCAALNMTNINVQLMTLEAARTQKKDALYQAAMLDPHTAAELSIDKIKLLCDELIEAHGDMLPKFK